jgi:opacity protein-like surface antigen
VRTLIGLVTGLGLVGLAVNQATAQTAQRFSVQASGLYAHLYGDAFDGIGRGLGGEAQLRYTPSAFSIGAGFQYTDHDTPGSPGATLHLYGGFLEPRYVIDVGSGTLAPYVSTRFSILSQKLTELRDTGQEIETSATGVTLNGGGGVLIRLGSRVNLDVGSTFGYTRFGESETEGVTNPSASGSNIVVRIGLALGLGG